MVQISPYAAMIASASSIVTAQQNQPPPCPENAQIGKLSYDVTCALADLLNSTFNAVFTATAPVTYGSGQEIYYTDTVGIITVPASIAGLGPDFGATQASVNTTIQLTLSNASPAELIAYSGVINNISLSGSDVEIRIPSGNGTLPPIGPVTLGTADVPHRIFLGEVVVDLTLQDAHGNTVLIPIPITCGQQNVNYVVGSINVDNSTGPPFAPSVGYVTEFQPTSELQQSGYYRFPYQCTFGPLGLEEVDLIIGGTLPVYFSPDESFDLTQADSFLFIPSTLITLASEAFPNATTIETEISEFNLLFDNASPSTFNVASPAIITSVGIDDSSAQNTHFVIPIPQSGQFSPIGPFTAGTDGTFAALAVGNAVAVVYLKDDAGNQLLSLDVTCNPAAPLELIAVPISANKPGNYTFGINEA